MGFTTRKITLNWPISAEFITFPNIVPKNNHRREITFSVLTKDFFETYHRTFCKEVVSSVASSGIGRSFH